MPTSIVLIGPYLAGKSTLRRMLAAALHREECALVPYHDDALCEQYYLAGGYDPTRANAVFATGGPDALYDYMKPFEAYAVEQCLAEHPGQIIELGAAHVVHDDPHLYRQVQRALAPEPHVVLLVPSPDRSTSYHVLRQRYWDLIQIDEDAALGQKGLEGLQVIKGRKHNYASQVPSEGLTMSTNHVIGLRMRHI